ncbi:MAG: hypothetical protein NXI24_11105 [bacterium]|nr:hypothetical protein [bacterium]
MIHVIARNSLREYVYALLIPGVNLAFAGLMMFFLTWWSQKRSRRTGLVRWSQRGTIYFSSMFFALVAMSLVSLIWNLSGWRVDGHTSVAGLALFFVGSLLAVGLWNFGLYTAIQNESLQNVRDSRRFFSIVIGSVYYGFGLWLSFQILYYQRVYYDSEAAWRQLLSAITVPYFLFALGFFSGQLMKAFVFSESNRNAPPKPAAKASKSEKTWFYFFVSLLDQIQRKFYASRLWLYKNGDHGFAFFGGLSRAILTAVLVLLFSCYFLYALTGRTQPQIFALQGIVAILFAVIGCVALIISSDAFAGNEIARQKENIAADTPRPGLPQNIAQLLSVLRNQTWLRPEPAVIQALNEFGSRRIRVIHGPPDAEKHEFAVHCMQEGLRWKVWNALLIEPAPTEGGGPYGAFLHSMRHIPEVATAAQSQRLRTAMDRNFPDITRFVGGVPGATHLARASIALSRGFLTRDTDPDTAVFWERLLERLIERDLRDLKRRKREAKLMKRETAWFLILARNVERLSDAERRILALFIRSGKLKDYDLLFLFTEDGPGDSAGFWEAASDDSDLEVISKEYSGVPRSSLRWLYFEALNFSRSSLRLFREVERRMRSADLEVLNNSSFSSKRFLQMLEPFAQERFLSLPRPLGFVIREYVEVEAVPVPAADERRVRELLACLTAFERDLLDYAAVLGAGFRAEELVGVFQVAGDFRSAAAVTRALMRIEKKSALLSEERFPALLAVEYPGGPDQPGEIRLLDQGRSPRRRIALRRILKHARLRLSEERHGADRAYMIEVDSSGPWNCEPAAGDLKSPGKEREWFLRSAGSPGPGELVPEGVYEWRQWDQHTLELVPENRRYYEFREPVTRAYLLSNLWTGGEQPRRMQHLLEIHGRIMEGLTALYPNPRTCPATVNYRIALHYCRSNHSSPHVIDFQIMMRAAVRGGLALDRMRRSGNLFQSARLLADFEKNWSVISAEELVTTSPQNFFVQTFLGHFVWILEVGRGQILEVYPNLMALANRVFSVLHIPVFREMNQVSLLRLAYLAPGIDSIAAAAARASGDWFEYIQSICRSLPEKFADYRRREKLGAGVSAQEWLDLAEAFLAGGEGHKAQFKRKIMSRMSHITVAFRQEMQLCLAWIRREYLDQAFECMSSAQGAPVAVSTPASGSDYRGQREGRQIRQAIALCQIRIWLKYLELESIDARLLNLVKKENGKYAPTAVAMRPIAYRMEQLCNQLQESFDEPYLAGIWLYRVARLRFHCGYESDLRAACEMLARARKYNERIDNDSGMDLCFDLEAQIQLHRFERNLISNPEYLDKASGCLEKTLISFASDSRRRLLRIGHGLSILKIKKANVKKEGNKIADRQRLERLERRLDPYLVQRAEYTKGLGKQHDPQLLAAQYPLGKALDKMLAEPCAERDRACLEEIKDRSRKYELSQRPVLIPT